MNYDLYMILTYGIIFGILIMTIIYTLIRYIYSKELMYIAYCFMQFFSLIFIYSYSKLFETSKLIEDLSLLFATLSALVFAISFYEGRFFPIIKNNKELFINTILLNIVILTSFYHYMLFEYIPYTIIYAILFISVIFNIKQGYKPTLIYVIGWSIFCLLLFIFDFKTYYQSMGHIDIVLLAFAIEAVLFTLSVSYKYAEQKKHNIKIENMLLHQSKLAKTGELIANITHQFRQPLNNISYILINIKKRFENEKLDKKYLERKINQANEQLNFLSNTVENFKEFYAPSKQKENFSINECIKNTLSILSSDLKKQGTLVNTKFNTHEDIKVYGVKNELSQVLLALISNANEALKDTFQPYINISVDSTSAEVIINIEDNAGGINKKNMQKIFEPYFTTKQMGSGIGLYLAKTIIENSFAGKIEHKNTKKGACFSLFIEKSFD
ncbi:MAG: ATP-binding protein [Halarcobacter sp.]